VVRAVGALARSGGKAHVALNITNRCNQRCVFCFEGDRRGWKEPGLGQVKRLLQDAARTSGHVVFMGAEALLRPDILEVLRFGRSLDLELTAFTNGQVLAREGFVEQLAEAGLRNLDVSFHYADPESFARGTRTSARNFDRLLRGLSHVRNHNRQRPDRALHVAVETELFSLNRGRLSGIRRLLERALGASFTSHRLGTLSPAPDEVCEEPLLEPLAVRRRELVRFLETQPPERRTALCKMPLCLAPGWEHLSMDLHHKLDRLRVRCNFRDREVLAAMHDFAADFAANPYRWVCSDCNLLPICRTERTRWGSRSFGPTREQKPIPETVRSLEEVLARASGGQARPVEQIETARRLWRGIPAPEKHFARWLGSLRMGGLRVKEVACGEHPAFDVWVLASGRRLRLRLSPLETPANPSRSYLLHYLSASVVEPLAPPESLVKTALARLAAAAWPPLESWVGYAALDSTLAAAGLAVWRRWGRRVWPGEEAAPGWTSRRLQPAGGSFRLTVEHRSGRLADALLRSQPRGGRGPLG